MSPAGAEQPETIDPRKRDRQPQGGWVLASILLAVYFGIKLQGWAYAREVISLERQLEEIRPALSAIVLSEQLENTRRACEEVSARVRQLDMKHSQLLSQLSSLPASITLRKLELHSRLTLPVPGSFTLAVEGPSLQARHGTRIGGVFFPGARDPESTLAQWAHTLQEPGDRVVILKLAPSFQTEGMWEFELEVEDA